MEEESWVIENQTQTRQLIIVYSVEASVLVVFWMVAVYQANAHLKKT